MQIVNKKGEDSLYSALVLFGQRRKMFIERQVIEKHLLEGEGTLIFLSNMLNASSLKKIQHKLVVMGDTEHWNNNFYDYCL